MCIPIFGNCKVLLSLSLVFHFSIAFLITWNTIQKFTEVMKFTLCANYNLYKPFVFKH